MIGAVLGFLAGVAFCTATGRWFSRDRSAGIGRTVILTPPPPLKPHPRLMLWQIFEGAPARWICKGAHSHGDIYGWGRTPKEAYLDWNERLLRLYPYAGFTE